MKLEERQEELMRTIFGKSGKNDWPQDESSIIKRDGNEDCGCLDDSACQALKMFDRQERTDRPLIANEHEFARDQIVFFSGGADLNVSSPNASDNCK